MEIKFKLLKDEVKEAMFLTGKIKTHKITSVIQTILCGILIVVFLMNIIYNPTNLQNYIFIVVGIILIPIVWILPKKTIERIIESSYDKREIRMELLEEIIIVNIDSSDTHWEAHPDRIFNIRETETIYVLELTDKRVLVIPKRAIQDDKKEKASQLIKTLELPEVPEALVE